MKFPYQVLHEMTDVQFNFEKLQQRAILDSTPQNFLQLLTAATVALNAGTATLTFSASTTASVTVTHNIGRSPLVWLQFNGSPGVLLTLGVDTITTTQFTIHGLGGSAITGSLAIFWLAIG